MSRRTAAALTSAFLMVAPLLAVVLGGGGGAGAQTPTPSSGETLPVQPVEPSAGPTGAGTSETPGTLRPTDVAAPTEEVSSVIGAANPVDAPLLGAGTVVDTILQSETLWYAVDAAPGQRVGATILVLGRPDGPEADDTFLAVTVTDPQRQPLDGGDVEFSGQEDGLIELPTVEIPAIGGDQPLLSVALLSTAGATSLQGTGYRLQLTVVIGGDPLPPAETAPPVTDSAPEPEPEVTITSEPTPPPGDPDVVSDLLPFALVSLAVGGFAGFELSRRGL